MKKLTRILVLLCALSQSVWADYFVASGTFNCPSATGSQTVTGVGFQPKAVLLFATKVTADGTAVHYNIGLGYATASTAEASIAVSDTDAVTTTSNRRSSSNADTVNFETLAGNALTADFTSFGADGFTLNWTAVNNGVDVHYLAWGGSDITNVKAGTFNQALATGNQAVTGVGFQGEFGIFLHSNLAVDDSSSTNGQAGFGAAVSSSAQWAQNWLMSNGVTTSVAVGTQVTTACITLNSQFGIVYRADFVSWDSDGFTINNSTVDGEANRIHYLVFAGGQYKVGAFDQPGSTGNQAVTGVGFTPKGVLLSSYNHAANVSQQNHARTSIGAGIDSTNRRAIWAGTSNGVTTTVADQATLQTKVIRLATEGTPTTNAEADFVSNDSDGFTINWSTVDATARQVVYMAFGANPPATNIVPVLSGPTRARRQ